MIFMPNKMVLKDNFKVFLILCMVSMGTSRNVKVPKSGGNQVNVMDQGAVGDGQKDDTEAFIKAWKMVCGASYELSLYIPEAKTFLLNAIEFEGPCKSSVKVIVGGEIIAPIKSKYSGGLDSWIHFAHVNGLSVEGGGSINGNGNSWWSEKTNEKNKPTALRFTKCNNLKLSGLTHKDSQLNHISITSCEEVDISGIHISAPNDSPNTDGIDISGSSKIKIQSSFIGSGDDCIAINGGTSFVDISDISCGPGHGISVGSLGKGGREDTVEEIHVRDSTFDSTQNGVRIKTWEGGRGYARKISFHNITFTNTKNPIIVDQHYCPHKSCSGTTSGSAVKISDISYTEIHGTSISEEAIALNCDKKIGCSNVVFNSVNITSIQRTTDATCENAHGTSKDTFPQLQCLKYIGA